MIRESIMEYRTVRLFYRPRKKKRKKFVHAHTSCRLHRIVYFSREREKKVSFYCSSCSSENNIRSYFRPFGKLKADIFWFYETNSRPLKMYHLTFYDHFLTFQIFDTFPKYRYIYVKYR